MINKIISALCTALYNEFGYTVYKERIEQGFEEPCFFVRSVDPTITDTITNRDRHEYQYAITFFPEKTKPYEAINSTVERLYSLLNILSVEGVKIRGKDVQTAVTDDVLTFMITYDFFMINVQNEQSMDDYTVTQRGE